jgi:hypothetical protein
MAIFKFKIERVDLAALKNHIVLYINTINTIVVSYV